MFLVRVHETIQTIRELDLRLRHGLYLAGYWIGI